MSLDAQATHEALPRSAPFGSSDGVSRRRFLGYLIAAPTLIAAADLRAAGPAGASLPTVQPVDVFDLTDLLTDAALLTASFITVKVNHDGSVSFALPRAEVGQGITTAVAMVIADEMDLPLGKVNMTLSDARPELMFNQLTGGSNSIHSLYNQVRVAAATAKGQLTRSAAEVLGAPLPKLKVRDGVILAANGREVSYGSLAGRAAVSKTRVVLAQLKPRSGFNLVGTPQRRIDALAAVTGGKKFAMDLEVPGAMPTMVCRPPTINGSALSVRNLKRVRAMPGVTDVAIIPHTKLVPGGVAVRARTFGQCIDA
jgi:isoquinoline 1-oxidoreductase subunit beta